MGFRQNKEASFSTLHFDEILVLKEETNAQEICENVVVDKKSAYVIYELSQRKRLIVQMFSEFWPPKKYLTKLV